MSTTIAQLALNHDIPAPLVAALEKAGYTTLYPPQEEALRSGVLEGKNLVLAVPTAAGKTFVAEVCMLKSILKDNGRCLYVVPLRALASEKFEDFKKRYSGLGVSVGIATGEYDEPGNKLARHDILIATSEKVDSLLRRKARWLAESVTVAVLDEIHCIHDESRGPTLEIVAARLRQVNRSLQVLALSATIENGEELAGWLEAELVTSDWRPVPLTEGVHMENTIYYSDFTTREVAGSRSNPLEAIVTDTLSEGGQVLVFVNSRRSTRACARRLGPRVRGTLSKAEKASLAGLAGKAVGVLSEPTHLCHDLADCIRDGVAFHHAGLHHGQRKLIEDGFRSNLIKAICATPTLAAGVNLPARRVVIRDWRRYTMGSGLTPIPVFEYKQFAGRAGRPGYDTAGESVLMVTRERDRDLLFDRYIHASTEPLRSQLGGGGALAGHVLGAIAAGYTSSLAGLMEFLSRTFFAYQQDIGSLTFALSEVVGFLIDEEMVYCEGSGAQRFELTDTTELLPTAFGSIISSLYLDPRSGTVLRDGLRRAADGRPTEKDLLHLVCCCPDMGRLSVGKTARAELSEEIERRGDSFLVPFPEEDDDEGWYRFLAALRTARMLGAWITEKTEEFICDKFGIGPGDIRRLIEGADWLTYSAGRVSSLYGLSDIQPLLKDLRRRVLYGVKAELLDLVSLKGIGRVRARNLFANGYKTLASLRGASVKKISSVPTIGPQIAESIGKQLK